MQRPRDWTGTDQLMRAGDNSAGGRAGLTATLRGPGGRRVVLLATLQVVLVWIIAVLLIYENRRDAIDAWKRTAENTALSVTAYIGQAIRSADLVQHSVLDWIRDEQVESESQFREVVGQRQFHDAMRSRTAGVPQISVIGIVARDGTLLSSTHEFPSQPLNLSDREAFLGALASDKSVPLFSAPVTGRATGRATFYLARRVMTLSGETLGVVTVGLGVDYFADFFRHISVGDDSWITLYRADGTMLATSVGRTDMLGKRFENSLPRRIILDGGSGRAVLTDEPSWRNPAEPKSRILVAREVDGYPLFISLVVGKSVFLAPWEASSRVILGLALAVTAVTIVVALWLLRLLEKSATANRLASERSVLAAIVDTPSAMTAVLDAGGAIVRANLQFHTVFGPRDLHTADLEGKEALFDFIAGRTELAEVDLTLRNPGEPPRQLHFSLSRQALPDAGGCIVMVGHDETLRHQARLAIEQSAKLVTLGEITTGIAHEISQPLNVIRMAAQNALAEIEPDAELPPSETPPMNEGELRTFVAAKLHRVIAQVDRAASIIARMRIFSRSTREGRRAFDVRDACQNATALVRQQFQRNGIEIRTSFADEPLMVMGYQPTLEQVVVSLLVNARDSLLAAGQYRKLVQVTAERSSQGGVVILVSDNGPGVPSAIRERIFEPFFTTKPVGEGTGLGLATSYGVVRDAGGMLSLVPEGPGATFRIELPAAALAEVGESGRQTERKS